MTSFHAPDSLKLQELRRRIIPIIIGIIISAHHQILLMSEEPKSQKAPKAIWNDAETDALVTYLHSQCSKIGDGGNFRSQVYSEAATTIANHRTLGPTKTMNQCKNKWQSVCYLYIYLTATDLKISS